MKQPATIAEIFAEVGQQFGVVSNLLTWARQKLGSSDPWAKADLAELGRLAAHYFNEKELPDLCLDLGLEYDELPPGGRLDKARELVLYLDRRNRLGELIERCQTLRPGVNWEVKAQQIARQWQQVNWEETTQVYVARLKDLYGKMRIFGQPKPVPLEGIFTDVYVLDKPSAWRWFSGMAGIEQQYVKRELPEEGANRQTGLEVVQQTKRLFILGKPGAGKTTFLKYMTLQGVENKLGKVPIFVGLKEWADSGQPLLEFIAAQFRACNLPDARLFVDKLLQTERVILLLDGLDEAGQTDDSRKQLSQVLQRFSRQEYPNCQFLITCRIAATDYSFEQFTYTEMADFAPAQVETFVKKWFRGQGQKGQAFWGELQKQENQGLQEMTRTPLLLTMLCLTFDETMTFPQRRVEIYEEALNALLKKWDSTRDIKRDEVYRFLSLGRKRQLLGRLAAAAFEKGEYIIPRQKLEKQIVAYLSLVPEAQTTEIDGGVVLQAMEAQHGLLIERAAGYYSFSHLTFQEYFTARHLVDQGVQGKLQTLLGQHFADPQWREVFLFVVSLLDEADSFFDTFLKVLVDFISTDVKLADMLAWAAQKAIRVGGSAGPPNAQRGFYIYHALARNHAHALDRPLARYLDLALDRNLALDCARPLARDLAHTLDLALDLTLDCPLDRDLQLDLVLSYAFAVAQAGYVWYLFLKAVNLSKEMALTDLTKALTVLAVPGANATPQSWQLFCQELAQVLWQHRGLKEWRFNEEQVNRLTTYLEGNLFLLECLKRAVVTDRQGIEDRMLLSPGESTQ